MSKPIVLSLAAAAIGLLAVAGSIEDRILFNASPSAPVGFFLRSEAGVSLGSFVTVRAVDVAPGYARSRDFTDPGDRFIKRVGATTGTRVCAGDGVVIIGTVRLQRHSHDRSGRPLPGWAGCRVLGDGEIFLLGDTPDSFDSRYFGVVRTDQIEGVWRRL